MITEARSTKFIRLYEMTFCTGLTFNQAVSAMRLANESIASQHVMFFMSGNAGETSWNLSGRLRSSSVENIEQYLIEINV